MPPLYQQVVMITSNSFEWEELPYLTQRHEDALRAEALPGGRMCAMFQDLDDHSAKTFESMLAAPTYVPTIADGASLMSN